MVESPTGGGRVSTTSPTAQPSSIDSQSPVATLPQRLLQFVVDQNYEQYTPMNHAVWRYIMRQNYHFLKDHAHKAYVEGLQKTGIGLEAIPRLEEMDKILSQIGWGAVTVDGFIPPAAFMEFQAYKVLVIAADMRQINHIEYTPAPDIVHEAAGHAPIIADPRYAEYLRRFGEYGSKAISSRKDYELYEAIRHLSILKEASDASPEEIEAAQRDVEEKQANLGDPSEMARLTRLHWWTVEFGLVGDMEDPKIYGAGLLSSIGESVQCLTPAVKKIPYSLETAEYAFDITSQQPHLFVTPDFDHLLDVLEQFAETMAFRLGGMPGLQKALDSRSTATAQYSSGLQVSGTFTEVLTDEQGEPAYIKTTGPSALAVEGRQLPGHGKDYHAHGYSSPVGRLAGYDTPLEDLDDSALAQLGLVPGREARLDFASGVVVEGEVRHLERHKGRLLLVTFDNCRVTWGEQVLFEPEWGTFDLAVGEKFTSVFHGSADKDAFQEISLVPQERTIKAHYDEATRHLFDLYQQVRDIREGGASPDPLPRLWQTLQEDFPQDWLLSLEIAEILTQSPQKNASLLQEIRHSLQEKAQQHPHLRKLIDDGLRLLAA